MNIQPINDERLMIKNLKNIRIAYTLQTLGIVAILGYKFVIGGMDGLTNNPLWLLFIASTIILAFLSLRTDERLSFNNLQKIRAAYAVQTIGIVIILGYELVTAGLDTMTSNPLWLVFIITTTVLTYLSMNQSVAYERKNNTFHKKGLIISISTITFISITVGMLTSFSKGYTMFEGLLTSIIFFICGSIPFLFLFHLRRRNYNS